MHSNDSEGMANIIDSDQTIPSGAEQSDLGLHCLPIPVFQKTYYHHGTCQTMLMAFT